MQDHVAKPVTPQTLMRVMAAQLGGVGASYDILAVGEGAATVLRPLGHRVFPVSEAAALTMLGARDFDMVVLDRGDAGQVGRFRDRAPTLPILVLGDVPVAGADAVLPPGCDGTVVAAVLSHLASQVSGDLTALLGADRLDHLRALLFDSLRHLRATLAAPLADARDLAQIAHRLKGSAATLGLHDLALRAAAVQAVADAPQATAEALDAARRDLYTTVDGLCGQGDAP